MGEVSRAQLVTALKGAQVVIDVVDGAEIIRDARGPYATGTLRYPADVAAEVLAHAKHGGQDHGEPGEFDRAYVINGEDLRHALKTFAIDPAAAAAHILGEIEVTGAVAVSERQLAAVVRGRLVDFIEKPGDDPDRFSRPAYLAHPDEFAANLLDELSANAALRDRNPWADDHEDDVVDAHIHCEHAPESRASSEVAVMDKVVALLGNHQYDGGRRAKRILRWAWDYLTDGDEPPF